MSKDEGAIETLNSNKERMKKLAAMIGNVTKMGKKNKLKDMMEKTEIVVHGLMIYPNSKFHVYWDLAKLFVTVYYCIAIPVRLCWNLTGGGWPRDRRPGEFDLSSTWDNTILIDLFLDMVFVADLIGKLRFFAFTDYSSGRSEVVVDRERIRRHYIVEKRDVFLLDLFISFPFDIFGPTGYCSLLRVPKILRITQLIRSVKSLQKHLEDAIQVRAYCHSPPTSQPLNLPTPNNQTKTHHHTTPHTTVLYYS